MTNSSSLKQSKSTSRLPQSGQRGQALVFLIIVIAVIAGGLFFLISMRKDAKAEGERFVRQVIERCAFQHDVKFLHASVASDRRLAVPPAMDDQFIYYLTKLGVPDRNYNLTGQLLRFTARHLSGNSYLPRSACHSFAYYRAPERYLAGDRFRRYLRTPAGIELSVLPSEVEG